MERTKEEWQAIGKVLAHGICPGMTVYGVSSDTPTEVPPVDEWGVGITGSVYAGRVGYGTMLHSAPADYATCAKPQSLSGKEVSVTIDGETYTAIIK